MIVITSYIFLIRFEVKNSKVKSLPHNVDRENNYHLLLWSIENLR